MRSIQLLLIAAVVVTGLWVVHTQHAARQTFVAIEESRQTLRRAEQDNDHLEVEKRAQATPLRVEALAKGRLNMRPATPSVTQYVALPAQTNSATEGKP